MAIEQARQLVLQSDGTYWSDRVTVIFQDEASGKEIIFIAQPERIDEALQRVIKHLLEPKPNANEKQQRLSKLMKIGIRGLLTLYGRDMLDSLYGSPDHDKPGKKDDLLEWYTTFFSRMAIGWLMRNDVILRGSAHHEDAFEILGLAARPVAGATSTARTAENESAGLQTLGRD